MQDSAVSWGKLRFLDGFEMLRPEEHHQPHLCQAWKGTLMERTHQRTNKCPDLFDTFMRLRALHLKVRPPVSPGERSDWKYPRQATPKTRRTGHFLRILQVLTASQPSLELLTLPASV